MIDVTTQETETVAMMVTRNMSEHHIRVAVVGNVDAGKSTFIGSQVSAMLDDGRGSARVHVMKHQHELATGRTSTIGTHMFGLDINSKPVVGSTESEIAQKAVRLVTFMDLAGHEKYFKTTAAGVARGMADYALVLVNSMQPPTHMTLNHIKLCVSVGIPVVVVMTKVDRCPSHVFQTTKQEIQRVLKSPDIGLRPFAIRTNVDIDTVKDKITSMVLTPIIPISCVTGEGLDMIQQLLSALPQRRHHARKQRSKPFEYLVEDIFQVQGVGTVLSGFVTRGEWKKGEPIFFGPLKDGTIFETVPKSVHVAQTPVEHVWAGHSVCFAISKPPRGARNFLGKGMVAKKEPFQVTKTFTADLFLVKGNTVTIAPDTFEGTAHILHNKQPVRVTKILGGENTTVVRQGDHATLTFEFSRRPFYVRPGMRVILRDGHIRGYGVVVKNT